MNADQLKTILNTSEIDVTNKRVVIIRPPDILLADSISKRTKTCDLIHATRGGVAHKCAEVGEALRGSGKFPFTTLTCPAFSYLASLPLQSVDVIIWFGCDKDYDDTVVMAERALDWNGQLLLMTSNPAGLNLTTPPFEFEVSPEERLYFSFCKKAPGFMIASYPRCGTHMLRTTLNKHADISCATEVFNPTAADGSHRFKRVNQVLQTYWTRSLNGIIAHSYIGVPGGVTGFAAPQGYNDLWKQVPQNLKIISVRRRDLFARHVSHLKAKRTQVWNRENDNQGTNDVAVKVVYGHLIRDCDYVRKCWRQIDERFPQRLVVCYEDMVEDLDGQLKRVHEYLNVHHETAEADTSKLGRSLETDVTNYNEIMKKLSHDGGMENVTYEA